MRFLKNKIALANASLISQQANKHSQFPPQSTISINLQPISIKRRKRIPGISQTPENVRSTKNIAKNFGRAICTFATSHIALPYLLPICEEYDIKAQNFVDYVNEIKTSIDGLHKFRSILMLQNNDSQEIITLKEIFKRVSEIFIKNFSVNWIFSGKVLHKEAHLKWRFKMLRRIRCPELFTYIKRSRSKEKKNM